MNYVKLKVIILYLLFISTLAVKGQSWMPVGGDFTNWPQVNRSVSQNMAIDNNGFPISCTYEYGHVLRNWDGVKWNYLTSPAPIFQYGGNGIIKSMKINSIGQPYISCLLNASNHEVKVFRWNGIAWDSIGGQSFSQLYGGGFMVLDSLGNPIVVMGDDLIDSVVVKRWDGISWHNMPSTNLDRWSVPVAMERNHSGEIYLAVTNNQTQSLNILNWNGSTWQTIGSQLNQGPYIHPFMTLDSSGLPLVSYLDLTGNLNFKQWDGISWNSIASMSIGSNIFATSLVIKIDNRNQPIVAYRDSLTNYKLTVKRWNGSNWVVIGTDGISFGPVIEIYLGIKDSSNIYVQYKDVGQMNRVCVQYWNGIEWNYVGDGGVSKDLAKYRSIALDNSGRPFVAYSDLSRGNKITVRHWNDTIWTDVGNAGFSPSGAGHLIMTLDSSDFPIVAFQDSSIGNKLCVQRWNGSTWNYVGDSTGLSAGEVKYIGLTINNQNHPAIAFPDSISGGITIVKEWDGSVWNQLGISSDFSPQNKYQYLTVDSLGNICIVYSNGNGNSFGRPEVKRWNGNTWTNIGPPTVVGSAAAYQTHMIFDNLGNPIISFIAWDLQLNYQTVIVHQFNGINWNRISSGYGVNYGAADDPNLAIDHAGNLYVAYFNNEVPRKVEVRKYLGTSNWIKIAEESLPPSVDKTFNNNRWFEIDDQGNMFIAFNIGFPYVLKLGNTLTGAGSIPVEDFNFNLYPNPANDKVTVVYYDIEQSLYDLSITDINGRVLLRQGGTSMVGENSVEIETRQMINGIYLIKLSSGGKQTIKKLIVMN